MEDESLVGDFGLYCTVYMKLKPQKVILLIKWLVEEVAGTFTIKDKLLVKMFFINQVGEVCVHCGKFI